MVGKGGLPPLGLSVIQRAGEAALPNLEISWLECFSESLCLHATAPGLFPPPMLHWVKFNLVGLLGFALQTGVLFVLTHVTPQVGYLAATATAVELAVLNNFVWHQRWTWKDRPSSTIKETLRRLVKFNLTSGLFSIAGNLAFMSILVGRLGLAIGPANVASVVGCSIVSFILADRIAFECNANC